MSRDNLLEIPDLNKPAFTLFREAKENVMVNKCPMCKKEITAFRDKLSKKEYSISGMCQTCQDRIFGK